ncbi:MAG: (d)CMP kinase [Planctomycetes bacterium]|nr:(d)CMP kinase [Planctomycetota bacterium]
MIITIDGPAGSGKSTVARKLAAILEFPYLDTGAMYRAIAYTALQNSTDLSDERALLALAGSMDLDLDCGPTHTRVRVNGHDVSEAIRSMAVSAATLPVAKNAGIRALLVDRQRQIGKKLGSLVSEGRDQGSVVFPQADVKFVLEASLETRADRRCQELEADGEDADRSIVMENLAARDRSDAKQWEPLLSSGAATVIDTTEMKTVEVVDRLAAIVRGHLAR